MRRPVAKSAMASSSPSDCHDRLGLGAGEARLLAVARLFVPTALPFGRIECSTPTTHHFLSSISTRRLSALPSGVLLLATKLPAPR
jgi:hypothetical protein